MISSHYSYDDDQVLDGYLLMKAGKREGWKRFWCILKDDLFMFFNTKQVRDWFRYYYSGHAYCPFN